MTENEAEKPKIEGQKPLYKLRSGSVTGTIWENEKEKDGNKFKAHSVLLEKNYMDKEGVWHKTQSFGLIDLVDVIVISSKALEKIKLKIETNDAVPGQ